MELFSWVFDTAEVRLNFRSCVRLDLRLDGKDVVNGLST